MSNAADQIVLEARGISKRYPGTLAPMASRCDPSTSGQRIDRRKRRREVDADADPRGSGDGHSGELLLEGMPIRVRSPREAAALGITIVHQELSVLPNLDISENVFAGREPVKAIALLDRETEDRRSSAGPGKSRRPMPVRTKAAQLSLGSRQIVEIAQTLDQGEGS